MKQEIVIEDDEEEQEEEEDEGDIRTPIGSPSYNNSPISPRKLRTIELHKPADNVEGDKSQRNESDDRPMCRSLKRVRFPVKNVESEKLQRQVAEIATTLANIEKISLETAITMVEEQDENNNWKRVKMNDAKATSSGMSSASTDVGSSVSSMGRDTASTYSEVGQCERKWEYDGYVNDENGNTGQDQSRSWYYSAKWGWFQACLSSARDDYMLQARAKQGKYTRWKSKYADAGLKTVWGAKASNSWYSRDTYYDYPKWM